MKADNTVTEDRQFAVIAPNIAEYKSDKMMYYHFAALVESSDDAIIGKTLDGHIISWNQGAEKLYGYTAGEVLGKSITLIIPPDRKYEFEEITRRIVQGESIKRYETQRVRKDGTHLDIALTVSPIRDARGSVVAISAIAQNITERKRTEEALRQSESRFRLLTEAIPQIIWTTGGDGLPQYFNQRWHDYTGLTAEQSHANERVLTLHPDDIPRCQSLWQEAIASGKSYDTEYRLRSGQDGSYRWFLARALPVHDSKGNIVEWFGTSTDIDDQKRVEEDLREQERLRNEFIAMAGHELKTPITSIKAMNQLLQYMLAKKGLAEPVSYLERMDGQLDWLDKLISDLLDMTRISVGSVALVNEPVDFDNWLKGIIADLQQGSSHTITCTGSLGKEIVGDGDRLGQVVTNLITNAIKYSPETTAIEVGIVTDENSVIVQVRDHGIGIPQALQARIFERFFRAGLDKRVPGLGIGLYIASEIVRLHGGKIWVESVEGEGSTFSFSLPLV